jgi:hypothetical protein
VVHYGRGQHIGVTSRAGKPARAYRRLAPCALTWACGPAAPTDHMWRRQTPADAVEEALRPVILDLLIVIVLETSQVTCRISASLFVDLSLYRLST